MDFPATESEYRDCSSDYGFHPSQRQPHLQSLHKASDDMSNVMGDFFQEDDERFPAIESEYRDCSSDYGFHPSQRQPHLQPINTASDNMSNVKDDFSQEDDEHFLDLKQQGLQYLGTWHWTASEDQLLSAFGRHKKKDWNFISKQFEGRTSKACQDRWYLKLKYTPVGDEEPWTAGETQQLRTLHSAGGNWVQISEGLTTTTTATTTTDRRRRAAGECLRRWLDFHDAFPYPCPVELPIFWTPERKDLVETLRRAGKTWHHIAERVSCNPEYCRTFWLNKCWEDYRLWLNKDGTLNLSRDKEERTKAKVKNTQRRKRGRGENNQAGSILGH